MDGFANIEELKRAKRCYAWMMTAFDCAMDAKEPSEKEKEWFFEKQLNDEWFDLKDVVEKYDSLLPDSPERYKVMI